ncbi:MAG: hypothetical protein FRX49_12920 [Trebouxia sp. A1-2]|nr:MAG: hypothetical protein FRX49_12920 [Trebouxia sp. A1-2]
MCEEVIQCGQLGHCLAQQAFDLPQRTQTLNNIDTADDGQVPAEMGLQRRTEGNGTQEEQSAASMLWLVHHKTSAGRKSEAVQTRAEQFRHKGLGGVATTRGTHRAIHAGDHWHCPLTSSLPFLQSDINFVA